LAKESKFYKDLKKKLNRKLEDNGLGVDGSLVEKTRRLRDKCGVNVPDDSLSNENTAYLFLINYFHDGVRFPKNKQKSGGKNKGWVKRLNIFLKRKGLEPIKNVWECSHRINHRGVSRIYNIDNRSFDSLKNELCMIVKAWHKGRNIKNGVTKSCRPKGEKKSGDFYSSWAWKKLRFEVLKYYGAKCMLCGSEERICVDHIYPRKKFPHLEMSFDNLQVLCDSCNRGKSNDDYTDFRPKGNTDIFLDS